MDENRVALPSSTLLVRQSSLLRGRFSFQDEAAGSSPARPTKWLLTSGDANYFSLGFRWARMHPIRDEVCVGSEAYEPV